MKKNQLTTTKPTALILGKSKSLMGITKKILENKSKASQGLTPHEGITIIGNLMWAKEADEKMNWHDAMEYAKNLRLGGYDDWRLPTIEELGNIVTMCGGECVNVADNDDWRDVIDRNLENTQYQKAYRVKGFASHYYWSSTTYADRTSTAWIVNFNNGYTNNNSKSNTTNVRCVR